MSVRFLVSALDLADEKLIMSTNNISTQSETECNEVSVCVFILTICPRGEESWPRMIKSLTMLIKPHWDRICAKDCKVGGG